MKAARLATLIASLVSLVAAPVAHAAEGAAPAPPPAHPYRLTAPAQAFAGQWLTNASPPATLVIASRGASGVYLSAGNGFEAIGFASEHDVVAITRMAPPPGAASLDTSNGILRLERVDASTLRARYFDDLRGPPVREEAWTLQQAPPRRAVEREAAPGNPDLPRFGEYVYAEELPEAITKVPPVYPAIAREAGVDGSVMVQALIGKDGLVKDTKIVKSIPMLDAAAVECVRQWVFRPAQSKGQPVAVWVAIPVKFSLH